ncbi:dTDP-4-dehydrorhamnose reductase [Alicyclobacillus tolerans]|uniref:dTDP-4-dehydrorhamnose reductase n=1 Tax=Alicyclobacillus tolerans TaxID=90970 RepID=UPI001F001FD0|nr:dTDP-4-dehydrorhamnose reductase [Alicyclobacillus tolerans]MCF8563262.1 dTDP-4-dehydrorhamnose reductase [Alicyclobacillus tolerans]
MTVLVTGANGTLGQEVLRILKDRTVPHTGMTRQDLDVTDFGAVVAAVEKVRPHAVIHCAAYTKTDEAEARADLAYAVNAYGTRNVAVASAQLGSKFVYVSTDYVFDGAKGSPYHEFDPVNPLNTYGKSKLAGEQMAKTYCPQSFIVRTSWLYGGSGNHFLRKIFQWTQQNQELRVVRDEIGSPTYARDLAGFLIDLVETEKFGVYHACNRGTCSRYELACQAFAVAGIQAHVTAIQIKDLSLPTRRPMCSPLDDMAIRLNGFPPFRPWQDALREFITQYGSSLMA